LSGVSFASPTLAQEIVTITIVGQAAQNDRIFIDDVILTQNEPA